MKKYQPLILEKLEIHIPGIRIHQLALHRHLSETTAIHPHAHRYAQCLLYLSGQGRQLIGNRSHPIQTGTAVFLPPKIKHAFRRETSRRPMCLVIDFDWRGAGERGARVAQLPFALLREARQLLADVAHLKRQRSAAPPFEMSELILRLLHRLLEALTVTRPGHIGQLYSIPRKVESLLTSPDAANLPLNRLAGLAGYQHDYLNRLLKNQTGLTLGQFRARKLVVRAQQLLQQVSSVAEAASATGFTDPNYFSRWFRRQTGLTPSRWRRTTAPVGGMSAIKSNAGKI